MTILHFNLKQEQKKQQTDNDWVFGERRQKQAKKLLARLKARTNGQDNS